MNLRTSLLTILISLSVCVIRCIPASSQELKESDLKNVLITMKQENQCGCMSCCPVYSVSISGDGTVIYEGIDAVNMTRKQVYSISIAQVRELVAEFYKVDFFSLKERYTTIDNGDGTHTFINHSAPVTTSIIIKGRTKSVYNFYGAPEKLVELQKKIYEISQLDLYVKRT